MDGAVFGRLGAFDEQLLDPVGAVLGGQQAGYGAHFDRLESGRLGKVLGWLGAQQPLDQALAVDPLHDVVPDGAAAHRPGDMVHRRVVVVADPHPGHDVGGVADDPGVLPVGGGAGLGRGRPAEAQRAVGAKGRSPGVVVGQDAGHQVRFLSRQLPAVGQDHGARPRAGCTAPTPGRWRPRPAGSTPDPARGSPGGGSWPAGPSSPRRWQRRRRHRS